MGLEEARNQIDSVDEEIRPLLMQRMDSSKEVAKAKFASGDRRIYRADREQEILERVGKEVPQDRRAEYLAVVRKVMETSRMYQYGLFFDWDPSVFDSLVEGVSLPAHSEKVSLVLTRPNVPNAMSSILSMVGDYGYNMERMELLKEDQEHSSVTFKLMILGDLSKVNMKKLMYQLSMESRNFKILSVE